MTESLQVTSRWQRNVSVSMVGRILQSILGFFVVAYLARILGPAGFGLLTYAGAMLMYFSMLSSLGLHTLAGRDAAQAQDKRVVIGEMLSVMVVLALASYGILYGSAQFLPLSSDQRVILVIAGIEIIAGVGRITWAFAAIEKMMVPTVAGIVSTLARLAFIVILVHGPQSVGWAALSTSVSALMASGIEIFVFVRLVPIRLHFSTKLFFGVLKRSFPLTLSLMMTSIYNSCDTVMLGYLKGPEVVAVYGVAYKLTGFLTNIRSTYTQVSVPVIGRLYKKQSDAVVPMVRHNLHIALALALPVVVGGWIVDPQLIKAIFGETYSRGAYWPFRLLLLSWFVSVVSIHYNNTLVAIHSERSFTKAVTLGALFNVCANLWVIPRYGAIGAASVSLATECAVFGWGIVAAGRKLGYYWPRGRIILAICLNTLFMAIAAITIMRTIGNVALVIGLVGLVYLGLTWITGVARILMASGRGRALVVRPVNSEP